MNSAAAADMECKLPLQYADLVVFGHTNSGIAGPPLSEKRPHEFPQWQHKSTPPPAFPEFTAVYCWWVLKTLLIRIFMMAKDTEHF